VHTTLDTDCLLTNLNQGRSQIGILASGTPTDKQRAEIELSIGNLPGNIDKLWTEVSHPLYTIIQILETLPYQHRRCF
jgi:hypothetical protein